MAARAIEDGVQLKLCRDIIPAVNTVVCRLTASIEAMERRVEIRDSGISQRESVARVAKLNVILDCARFEDFAVVGENRPLTEVALEMRVKAGLDHRDIVFDDLGSELAQVFGIGLGPLWWRSFRMKDLACKRRQVFEK